MALNDLHTGLPTLDDVRVYEFISSITTWPIPEAVKKAKWVAIDVVGGGGGGGAETSGTNSGTGGASSGSAAAVLIDPKMLQQFLNITVGAGGAKSGYNATGGTGGTSSVVSDAGSILFTVSCPGGLGSQNSVAGVGRAAPAAPTITGSFLSFVSITGGAGGNETQQPATRQGGTSGGGGGAASGSNAGAGGNLSAVDSTGNNVILGEGGLRGLDGGVNGGRGSDGSGLILNSYPLFGGLYYGVCGAGGGGGGGTGGTGGDGGFPGGGGGGNGGNVGSGAGLGGNGGAGVVRIYWGKK